MLVVSDASKPPFPGEPSVITIGAYDGLHLGHQTVIREVRRQAEHIHILARDDLLLHRRLFARQFHQLRRQAQTALHFPGDFFTRHAEGLCNTIPAADDIADDLMPLRPCLAEQYRLWIALHDRGHIGERNRLLPHFDLIRRQILDKMTQPEAV